MFAVAGSLHKREGEGRKKYENSGGGGGSLPPFWNKMKRIFSFSSPSCCVPPCLSNVFFFRFYPCIFRQLENNFGETFAEFVFFLLKSAFQQLLAHFQCRHLIHTIGEFPSLSGC